MNNLPLSKQVEIISALCEGVGQRAVARLTDTDRKTVARIALRVGRGCAELHDRMMVGLRVHRIECDELWAYVGHKRNPQAGPKRRPSPMKGDQYTYIALAASTRAIIGYRTGKRDTLTTDDFIQDLRQRVIGVPEISTDGFHPYTNAIRDAFGGRAAHGVINKTYSVTHLNVTEASRRYSPAQVVAVERVAVEGEPRAHHRVVRVGEVEDPAAVGEVDLLEAVPRRERGKVSKMIELAAGCADASPTPTPRRETASSVKPPAKAESPQKIDQAKMQIHSSFVLIHPSTSSPSGSENSA